MPITIETPTTDDELVEFVTFQDEINARRGAYWPAVAPMVMPLLKGEGEHNAGRTVKPFVARDGGEIVARMLAIVDDGYLAHWQDGVGHTSMFEALPGTTDAVRALANEACGWLRERGMRAARAGFGPGSDFPFSIDTDGTLPPVMLRNNPSYYHALLKEAGYESERAWTDYRAAVSNGLVERWRTFVTDAERRGYRMVPYGEVAEAGRADSWVELWNEAFRDHWGVAPQTVAEHTDTARFLMGFGMGETSFFAYEGDTPVGAVWVVPELASALAKVDGRALRDEEKVNFLAIGVSERARRKGVNLALAASAYLELAERGATHVSYTLVLDDNWPSRRTAEKLGASICGNYMVYRRNFG